MTEKRGGKVWTKEEDDCLRVLWLDKKITATVISKKINRSVSSVRSRAIRLGLPRRKAFGDEGAVRKSSVPQKKVINRPEAVYKAFGIAKKMYDLEQKECHFSPEGMDGYFCAAPALDHYGYCKEHERVCKRFVERGGKSSDE